MNKSLQEKVMDVSGLRPVVKRAMCKLMEDCGLHHILHDCDVVYMEKFYINGKDRDGIVVLFDLGLRTYEITLLSGMWMFYSLIRSEAGHETTTRVTTNSRAQARELMCLYRKAMTEE